MLRLRRSEKLELVPQPKKQNKNSRKMMLGFMAVAILAVGGAYAYKLYQDGFFTEPPRPAKPKAAQNAHLYPPPEPRAQERTASRETLEPDSPLRAYAREKSEALTVLLADKEVLAAQLENARLEQQIAELAVPAQPVVVAQPDTDKSPQAVSHLPLIRSITGFDGKLTAVLVFGGASRAVKTGDDFAGGRIVNIHLHGVDFRTEDGSVHALNFED